MQETRKTDVLVIGCGVLGASIAMHLAENSVDVTVVERARVGSEASSANAGTIACAGWGDKTFMKEHWMAGTVEILRSLQNKHGYDIELCECGSIELIRTDDEMKWAERVIQDYSGTGYNAELVVGNDQCRKLEPKLAQDVKGLLHYPQSVHANPSKTTIALANRAMALGAHIFEGHEVKHLAEQHQGFHVITSKGSFQCGKLVIAAGAWAPAVGRQLGLDIPVVPVKGQMWATTPQPPGVIQRVIYAAESHSFWKQKCTTDYATGSPANVTHDVHTKQKLVRHVYGRQCQDGRIIFGGDRVVCDTSDYKIDQDGIRLNKEHIAELLPVVKGLEIETTWSGIMPFSMDGRPHLGPVKCMQGVYVATGFSSAGFMLGPMAGVMLANTILGKHDGILAPAEPCRPGPGGIRLLVAPSARLPSKL